MSTALLTILMALLSHTAVNATPATQTRLHVVTSFSILADMTEQIGGDKITVSSLVRRDADIHEYTPSPDAARLMTKTKLVIINGLGFEGWISRLTETTGYRGSTIVASDGITTYGNDSHAWLDLKNALIYSDNIRKGLCVADTQNCFIYITNAEAYKASIKALDASLHRSLSAIPANRRKILVPHDAFAYFEQAYGVKIIAPQGFSVNAEASAARIARLIKRIRQDDIRAILLENRANPRLIQRISDETGTRIIHGTLYIDNLSEHGGPAATYLDMMRHNAHQILLAISDPSNRRITDSEAPNSTKF